MFLCLASYFWHKVVKISLAITFFYKYSCADNNMVPPNFIAYLDSIYPSNTLRDLHGKIYVVVNTLTRINIGFMEKHIQCTDRTLMGDKVKPCGFELITKRKHLHHPKDSDLSQ